MDVGVGSIVRPTLGWMRALVGSFLEDELDASNGVAWKKRHLIRENILPSHFGKLATANEWYVGIGA